MSSSINEQQVLWATAASKTVSSSGIQWSDAILFNAEDWDGSLSVSAANQGTPANGDTCQVWVAWTNGDLLGDSGDDFDTDEHAQYLGMLDTYPANMPGENPARRTFDLTQLSGKKGVKFGVICPQAATRNIVVRMRLDTHRPQ